jgi:zinc-binding in reverse transcriptase
MKRRLQGIILREQVQDKVIWIKAQSEFTVKTQYKFLSEGSHISSSLHRIWKIMAPLRVSFFTCLRLRNAILTVDNLKRRGWQMVNICYMCYNEEETVQHLFSKCVFDKQIRRYIHDDIAFNHSFSADYTEGDPWLITNEK